MIYRNLYRNLDIRKDFLLTRENQLGVLYLNASLVDLGTPRYGVLGIAIDHIWCRK